MAGLNYRKQIFFPLITVSIILLAAMVWIFISAQQLIFLGQTKVEVEETRYEVTLLINSMIEAETGQRGYLLTGNSQFLESYERSLQTTGVELKQLTDKVRDFPYLKPHLDGLSKLLDRKFHIIKRNIRTELRSGTFAPHLRPTDSEGKAVMDQIRDKLQAADKDLKAHGIELVDQLNAKQKELLIGAILILSLTIAILLFSYYRTVWLFENAKGNLILAEKLGHLAMHDALTLLPNRRNFDDHLTSALSLAHRRNSSFAIFFMDLDGFKLINDTYGHDVGDKALIATSVRIKEVLRGSELFARIGGDEFAIIVENFSHFDELSQLAKRIVGTMEKPIFSIQNNEFQLGVSIGIACFPHHAQDLKTLVGAADSAMYKSKASGKNQYNFFEA